MPVAQVAERQHLRSASRNLPVAPRFQLNTYGRRAFAVAAPATRNSLSDELQNPDLHSATFRRNLKTFLFQQYRVHWAHQRRCAIMRYINLHLHYITLHYITTGQLVRVATVTRAKTQVLIGGSILLRQCWGYIHYLVEKPVILIFKKNRGDCIRLRALASS